jgi:type 1 glutamine amidotransferase
MSKGWLALAGIVFLGIVSQAPGADPEPKGGKKKLLVITESRGFVHGCVRRPSKNELCLVEKTITEIGKKSGDFDVVCSQDSRSMITAENLKEFDAVFFYTTGELPLSDTQKADLIAFVHSGKGFAGSHSATDTFYKWPEYGKLIGGYFDGHPWHTRVHVIVEDQKNPATKHLGESFHITDEIYQFKAPYDRSNLHVLMRLDMASVKNAGKRTDKDNALAWIQEFGKGRVFYTALGHRDELWSEDERFRQHIHGGLRYVLGLEKADATPSGPRNNR